MQYTIVALTLLLISSNLVSSFPEQFKEGLTETESAQADLSVEQLSDKEQSHQKREEEGTGNVPKGREFGFGGHPLVLGRQQFPVLGHYGYLEPQLQFPTFNFAPQEKQAFPRVQPQILLYGPGGQGQPILINPGNPPGNFLVPQAPGPNVLIRGGPHNPGVFGGDFPRGAHVPPIERDAEEIPTNPAKIPPLASSETTARPTKPQKLETFNEGKNQLPAGNEATPQEYPKLSVDSLRPGHRFFYLNGANLYPDYNQQPLQYPADDLRNYARPFPGYPQPPQTNEGPKSGPVLVGNTVDTPSAPTTNQQETLNVPTQNFEGLTGQAALQQSLGHLGTLSLFNQPLDPFFRQAGPLSVAGDGEAPEFGRFRFTPPQTGNIFPYRDDAENDAIVVDANFERDASSGTDGDSGTTTSSLSEDPSNIGPSMAQAAPSSTAIAGVGGVAGSAPRGTALVGRGGLAVASPEATAVAGTRDEERGKKTQGTSSTTKRSVEKEKN